MTTRTNRNEVYRDGVLVAEEVMEVDVTAEVNKTSIEDKITTIDMSAGKAIIDTSALSITGATVAEVRSSAQAAVRDLQRQVKDLARANRRLSRLLLQLLDGTE